MCHMLDFTWLVGGPQGSGVETASAIFARVSALAGYGVFGKREFYSNIKGEHSYFEVRISEETVRSNTGQVNLMAAYDAETIFRHYNEVVPGGAIMYDVDTEKAETGDVHTMDSYFTERLHLDLRHSKAPPTVRGALSAAAKNGVSLHPVSFMEILSDLAEKQNNPKLKRMKRLYNVLAVSLSMGMLGLPLNMLLESIQHVFSHKAAIAEINVAAATYAYNKAKDEMNAFRHISAVEKAPDTALVHGHQGTAIGKIVAGCRFQSYYPITPASDESMYLESNDILTIKGDRDASISVVQTEDEISAIGMMIGAALTGTRSSTSTSGPGFSLMAEALGWAGINEVPLVITLYQRSGPSTGLPTRHGQDDLLFAIFAGHGEFPRIVYASGDIEESFYDTGLCFNYSDLYQVPVIHMMDKLISSSTTTCPVFDPSRITIARGRLLNKIEGEYKRFRLGGDGISPRSYLGLKDGVFWNTGDESDEAGHITEDPVLRRDMMDKRLSRMKLIHERVPNREQAVLHASGKYTVVSWGSTKGPILDALRLLKSQGVNVGFLQIKMLHPFPTEYVTRLLKGSSVIIDVESNQTGQLGMIIKQNMGIEINHYILKYTGRAMTCIEIRDALMDIINGSAPSRLVLTHGA